MNSGFMVFHVVALREIFGEKFEIDLLFFGLSEEKIRNILHEYKLVALQLNEYKETKIKKYGKIKILIDFGGMGVNLLTNSPDIENIIFVLTIIGFDIKNINYVDGERLEQAKVDNILVSQKEKANQWMESKKNIALKREDADKKMFDNQKLKKTQILVKDFLEKIPSFIEKTKNTLPRAELKDLYDQSQELSKLEMGNNLEKLSTFFETVYGKYTKLEQEFLAIQKSPNIDVSGSEVSDAFLTLEITKMEKAKSLQKLGGAKSGDDLLYANLGGLLLYFRLIKKDIVSKFKDFSIGFSDIFSYLVFLLSVVIILCAIYVSLVNNNDFIFAFMVYCGVFGLVLYGIKFIKKIGLLFGVLLSIGSIIVSILIIRLLKQFFIF